MQDEHVLAAHVFQNFDEDFLVGEAAHIGVRQLQIQAFGHLLGEWAIGIPGEEFHDDRTEPCKALKTRRNNDKPATRGDSRDTRAAGK